MRDPRGVPRQELWTLSDSDTLGLTGYSHDSRDTSEPVGGLHGLLRTSRRPGRNLPPAERARPGEAIDKRDGPRPVGPGGSGRVRPDGAA
jgi:hypothetical protein